MICVDETTPAERLEAVRDLTEGRGADVIVECTGAADAIPEGLRMARRGAIYLVAGVFADVGDITVNPHRDLLANQIRLIGLTNHPPSGYVASMKLLARYQNRFPLHKFVTQDVPGHPDSGGNGLRFRS